MAGHVAPRGNNSQRMVANSEKPTKTVSNRSAWGDYACQRRACQPLFGGREQDVVGAECLRRCRQCSGCRSSCGVRRNWRSSKQVLRRLRLLPLKNSGDGRQLRHDGVDRRAYVRIDGLRAAAARFSMGRTADLVRRRQPARSRRRSCKCQ